MLRIFNYNGERFSMLIDCSHHLAASLMCSITVNLLNILNTEISGHGDVGTLTLVFTTHGDYYFQISFHETSNTC
jgi:hypothetical protein